MCNVMIGAMHRTGSQTGSNAYNIFIGMAALDNNRINPPKNDDCDYKDSFLELFRRVALSIDKQKTQQIAALKQKLEYIKETQGSEIIDDILGMIQREGPAVLLLLYTLDMASFEPEPAENQKPCTVAFQA